MLCCFPSFLPLHSHSGGEFGDFILKATEMNPVHDFMNSHPSLQYKRTRLQLWHCFLSPQNSLTLFFPSPLGNKNLFFIYLTFFLKTSLYLNIRRDYISFIALNTSNSETLMQCLRPDRIFPFQRAKIQIQFLHLLCFTHHKAS